MIFRYRILFFFSLILVLPFTLLPSTASEIFKNRFTQRLGLYPTIPQKSEKQRIWLQAHDVGEIKAIELLIEKLNESENVEIILTMTTDEAYKIALNTYANKTLFIGYFPLDFWWFTQNAWEQFKPDLAIIMEEEICPAHIRQAKSHHVPIVLINARLSDTLYQRLKYFKWFAKWLYHSFSAIGISNSQDESRIMEFMELPNGKSDHQPRLMLTGNLKFDMAIKPLLTSEDKMHLISQMGFIEQNFDTNLEKLKNKPTILLGSSTWPGEEKILIDTLNKAIATGIDCRLLLIPRHANRRDEIIKLLNNQPLAWHARSKNSQANYPTYIYLADTTGEITQLSQVADVAFIGKSLPPNNGGQTPIELAFLGIPMAMGPNMSNFREIAHSLSENNLAILAPDAPELETALIKLLKDEPKRQKLSTALKTWHKQNQGATQHTIELLKPFLTQKLH